MTKDNTTSKDYHYLSSRLEEVLTQIQSADVSVDEAVALYKEGTELVAALESYLKEAELKITKVTAS